MIVCIFVFSICFNALYARKKYYKSITCLGTKHWSFSQLNMFFIEASIFIYKKSSCTLKAYH